MPALPGFVDDGGGLSGPVVPRPDEPLIGAYLVRDVDLPAALDLGVPLRVVSTGGAGALAGPLRLAAHHGVRLAGLVCPLRDLDDLAGNARRVVAALDAVEVELPDVAVEVPTGSSHSFAAALDVLAERGLMLALRLPEGAPADRVAGWVEAALDRETPYVVTAGLDATAALTLLGATAGAWDGEPLGSLLADRGSSVDDGERLARGRRWFRSVAGVRASDLRAELTDDSLV